MIAAVAGQRRAVQRPFEVEIVRMLSSRRRKVFFPERGRTPPGMTRR
jgi:hypothetical protein